MGAAEKCREMGLQVGDTIEGKEGDGKGKWWDITRLTLLWLGDDVVVWSQTHTNHMASGWTTPKEEANWSLDYRDWRKVTPNALGEGRERGILREASSGEAATSTDGLGVAVPPAPTFETGKD